MFEPSRRFALALVLSLQASMAWAQAGGDCTPNGPVTTALACAVREAQRTDTAVQLRYAQQMAEATATQRPTLRKAHADWMRQRERICRQSTQAQQAGSAGALALQHCLVQENEKRLQALAGTSPSASAAHNSQP